MDSLRTYINAGMNEKYIMSRSIIKIKIKRFIVEKKQLFFWIKQQEFQELQMNINCYNKMKYNVQFDVAYQGKVFVTRNPFLYPGDIKKTQCFFNIRNINNGNYPYVQLIAQSLGDKSDNYEIHYTWCKYEESDLINDKQSHLWVQVQMRLTTTSDLQLNYSKIHNFHHDSVICKLIMILIFMKFILLSHQISQIK